MKSFKLYNGKRDKFSLRKKSVGLVSVAIATLAMYGIVGGSQTVQADEQSSMNSQVTSVSDSSEKMETEKVVAPTPIPEDASSVSGSKIMDAAQSVSGLQSSSTESTSSEDSSPSSSNSSSTEEESSKPSPTPSQSETTPKTEETNTAPQTRAARSRRSVTEALSQISDFKVTVTTRDGETMNAGSSKNLSAQEVSFEKVEMRFNLTQDGTLKSGDTIRIPVKLINNAYAAYYSNLSSGTVEKIDGVGTIKFDYSNPNDLAYVITLSNEFASAATNTQKAITITQRAASGAKFTAKSSKSNIELDINGNTFTFKPVPREFPKAQAPFAVYHNISTDAANSIKIGTSTGDANYYNNMLSSDGKEPGDTKIPTGDIITIHRIKAENGSKIVDIKPEPYRITSTLAISEDGKYLVNKDTSTSIPIKTEKQNQLISLPANSTDNDILKALKKAGKNSSVVINNGDGTYTVAINLGKMTGKGATTYHDIWPTDDYAQMGDEYQEINRSEEVNKKVSEILKNMSVIQGTSHSTRITFADSSINNKITGTSKSYSVEDDDSVSPALREGTITQTTTPSQARSEGQRKIAIHYVDTNGKEIATQDYQYGYPAGLSIAQQSPDYTANPKTILGYTLLTTDKQISSYGTQLKGTQKIPFTNDDQDFYYVYAVNKSSAKVTYIDDDTNGGKVLETKDLNGFYGQTDPYRTAETIKTYTDRNYELVSDNYPTNGVTYNETLQTFEVHLRHKVAAVQETKTVTETIKYVYEDNTQAADTKVQILDFNRLIKKDLVTNKIVYKGPWAPSTRTFPEVVSPKVDGYTPDKATVAAVEQITGDSADIEETVTYKADKQKVTYTIIDDTAQKTLKDKELLTSGNSDTPLPDSAREKYDLMVNAYLDQGYELVSKDQLPAKFDLDSSHDQNVVVHLKHGTTDIQESKSVNLTVRYHGAGGQTPEEKVQTATWTRTVTKDKITGTEVSATAWTSDKANYDAVPSPVIPGYTVDVAAVPSEAVTQENIVKDVYYTIQTQKVTYTVVDETTGQTLENQVELTTGESGAALPAAAQTKYDTVVAGYLAQGYEVASQDELPAQFDTDSSVDQNVVIRLKHKVSTSTETKTVTQTINYVYEEDNTPAAPEKKASLTFTREMKTDEVTKVTTPGAWTPSTGTFPEVVSPVVDGYTPDKAKVDAENVTANQEDITVTVKYKADKQKVTYTIIDDTTNTTLEDKQELTSGNSDTPLPNDTEAKYDSIVDAYLAQGYELVSKDQLPAKFDLDSSHDQNVVVHVKHGKTNSQESKNVNLTVRYHGAGGQTPADQVQTATWTRTVTTDKVTGQPVSATVWTSDKANYDAVPSPVIPGYSVDIDTVPSEAVTQENIVKDVHYTIQTQKVTYTVVDETTGQTLEHQVELTTGDSGAALPAAAQTKYDTVVAGYLAKGYEVASQDALPSQFDTDSSVDQNVVIRLKHKTVSVEETKQVSMTVRYHGAGSQTPADQVQTATWTRTVTKDKVTGDIVKTTDWTADKTNYNAVPSPVISGYTVDVATVAAEKVTQEDIVKDVHYTAVPVTPDKQTPTPPVVPSTPDKPTTPTVVPTTPTKPTPKKTEILPSTGDSQVASTLATLTGVGLLLSAFGYIGRRKKED